MIAVLDYGIGNLASAHKALSRVGADAVLCSDAGQAAEAGGIVVPGVGAFGACMEAVRAGGFVPVILDAVERGLPVLGICVGFQMLFDGSEENPDVPGLGVLKGSVRLLPEIEKRPQMQWNRLDVPDGVTSAMLEGVGSRPWVYFVHSYSAEPAPPDDGRVVATCEYGGAIVSAIERGPLWGCQFHPEKSGPTGLAILANFAATCL